MRRLRYRPSRVFSVHLMRRIFRIFGNRGFFILFFLLIAAASTAQNPADQPPVYTHIGKKDLPTVTASFSWSGVSVNSDDLTIAVATDVQGNVYTLSFGKGVDKRDANGNLLNDNFINGLKNPLDIAIDENGLIYIADYEASGSTYLDNGQIKIYDANGQYLRAIWTSFYRPLGIDVDEENLYIAEYNDGQQGPEPTPMSRVRVINKTTEEVKAINENIPIPLRIAVNSKKEIYISQAGNNDPAVIILDQNLNLTGRLPNIISPGSVVIDAFDYVHVIEYSGKVDFSEFINFGNLGLSDLKAIGEAIDKGIKNEDFGIKVFSPDDTFLYFFKEMLDFPVDIAFNSCDRMYVVNAENIAFTLGYPSKLEFDLEIYKRSPSADIIDPVALCLGNYTIDLAAGESKTLDPALLDNGSYDACGGVSFDLSKKTFTEANAGANTINFIVTDENGNQSTCEVIVQVNRQTVTDTTPPVITCPTDIVISNDPGKCGAIVTFLTPQATDNSGTPTVTQTAGLASGSEFPVGTTVLTFQAVDAAGLKAECSFKVIVEDNEAPQFTSCPGNISATVSSGETGKKINFSTPEFSDNCDGASMERTAGLVSGEIFPVGETTITFVVTDAAGKTNTCTFKVTITEEEDTEPPVITCPEDIVISNDPGKCGAIVTFLTPQATDNSGQEPTVVQTGGLTSGTLFPVGTTTLTFKATDAAGNPSECSYDVIVEDNEAPQFTICPGNISATVPFGETGKIITFSIPEFSDNCDGAILTQTEGPASGEKFPIGATTLTFVVTDASGKTDTCSFMVTVSEGEDKTPPVFECPETLEFLADEDKCGTVVTFPDPVVTDPSGILQLVHADGPTSGSFVEVGTHAVKYIATDNEGNTSYCTFYLNVKDKRLPKIDCPGEVVVAANTAGDFIVPDFRNIVSDNCGVASVNQTPAAGSKITTETEVVITAIDVHDNKEECKIKLILTQEEILQITTCAAPRTEDLGADCSFTLPDYRGEVVTNLEGDLTQNPPAGTVVTESTFITITAERNGKKAECAFKIELKDNTFPSQTCLVDKMATFNPDVGFVLPDYGNEAKATDNCDFEVLQDPPPGTVLFRSTSIFITVIDAGSNQSMCSFALLLQEEEEPVVNCKDVLLKLDAEGNAILNKADVFDGDINDPAIADVFLSKTDFSCDDLGENTVELTVKFKDGSSAVCNAKITVVDEEKPVISCILGASIRLNSFGTATVTPEFLTRDVNDNCKIKSLSIDKASFTEAHLGDNLVTVTAVDESGNTATCETTVTILPYEGTSGGIICPEDTTIPLKENGEVTISIKYDGDADVKFEIDKSFFTCHDLGTHTITVTYSGDYQGTCTSEITIVDVTGPVISCVSNLDVILDDNGRATISPEDLLLEASDNCGVSETLLSRTNFTTADIGEQQVTVTVKDASGNVSSCTTTVTVKTADSTEPEIQCVSILELELNEKGEATISPQDLFTGGPASGEYTISKDEFTCSDIGEQTIVFTYKTKEQEGSCNILVKITDPQDYCTVDPVEPPDSKLSLILYPNPSRGLVKVRTAPGILLERVEIFDMRGRFIGEQKLTADPGSPEIYLVNMVGYEAAVYTLKFYSSDQEYLRRAIISPE